MGSWIHFLAWATHEPKQEIIRKAGIEERELDRFSDFVGHVLVSSNVSRYRFMEFTLSHRLSWQVLGDFFREHLRRLQEDRRLYPIFDHNSPSDTPWNVHYVEWPNRFGYMGDSPFHCTVSYYWVHDDDIIGNYKEPSKWNQLRTKWSSFVQKFKSKEHTTLLQQE